MGARRLMALIKGLPEDSAVWRTEKPGWGTEQELLATIAEGMDRRFLDLIGVVVEFASGGKKPRLPKAIEITHPDRPGHAPRPKRKPAPGLPPEAGAFMAKLKGR